MTNEEHRIRREILTKLEPRMRGLELAKEDLERLNFLGILDASERVEVTEWEAGFIEGFLKSPRPMTPAQRAAVDAMRDQYEGEL